MNEPQAPVVASNSLFGVWMPIETAPKDGTEIIGYRHDCGNLLIRWDAPENFLSEKECEELGESACDYSWICADFVEGCRLEGDETPTHWMPLPNPPNDSDQPPAACGG